MYRLGVSAGSGFGAAYEVEVASWRLIVAERFWRQQGGRGPFVLFGLAPLGFLPHPLWVGESRGGAVLPASFLVMSGPPGPGVVSLFLRVRSSSSRRPFRAPAGRRRGFLNGQRRRSLRSLGAYIRSGTSQPMRARARVICASNHATPAARQRRVASSGSATTWLLW